MRIIAGKAKGRKLAALEGEAVRPTSDRVKEALFDIIQFRIEGRKFLDLFSGSGQIGIEALSRGADEAVFVDSSKASISVVRKNLENTGLAEKAVVINSDSLAFLNCRSDKFDLAFLDPPYRTGLLEKALEAVAEVMNPWGLIICEHPSDELLSQAYGGFEKLKTYRYGKIILESFQKPAAGE